MGKTLLIIGPFGAGQLPHSFARACATASVSLNIVDDLSNNR